MKYYDDHLEKIITAVFGILGVFAVLINLHIKGYGASDFLDAIKDMAGLIVVITVFLVTSKLFRREKQFDFLKLFEEYLKEWIYQNDYLISEELEGNGKGKFKTKFCSMLVDHSNFVTQKKLAKDAAHNREKATFVRLPQENKNEFEFRINERTFERQKTYRKENDAVDINAIIDQFSKRINDKFSHLLIEAKADRANKAIIVSFDNIDKTKENARKLIDIIEFAKTMVLALA
jgi:hypothetical protein